jgi:hypothetical protein
VKFLHHLVNQPVILASFPYMSGASMPFTWGSDILVISDIMV